MNYKISVLLTFFILIFTLFMTVSAAEVMPPPLENIPPVLTVYYEDGDAEIIAKVLYGECRGVKSDTEKACVVWTILNRVDNGQGSVKDVATKPMQFAYRENNPVTEELYNLASDVLERWNREKNGEHSVGRVLPENYRYFHGDGKKNYFRDKYKNGTVWDYSYESPYES